MVDLTGDEDSPSTFDLDDYAKMFRQAFPSRPPFETGQAIVDYGSAHGWFKAFRLTATAKNPRSHYQGLWARNATVESNLLINDAVLDCIQTWGADSALESLDTYGLEYDSLAAVTGMMFLALTWPVRKASTTRETSTLHPEANSERVKATMDPAEKRRLKKLGKRIVEERSRELRERLSQANPAPVGSDEWAQNYRRGTLKERELRQQQPDRIRASELERDFVLDPIDPISHGVPTYYVRCFQCGDVLHSCPTRYVECSCARLSIGLGKATRNNRSERRSQIEINSGAGFQWVRLIGKGTARPGFEDRGAAGFGSVKRWWEFWR